MSRTQDRTLLASLGFADPDRTDPRHTLACQYLTEPTRLEHVVRSARPEWFAPLPEVPTPPTPRFERPDATPPYCVKHIDYDRMEVRCDGVERGRCEVAVRRPHSSFLIGFWDVVASLRVSIARPMAVWSEDAASAQAMAAWTAAQEAHRRWRDVEVVMGRLPGKWRAIAGNLTGPLPTEEPPLPGPHPERFFGKPEIGWTSEPLVGVDRRLVRIEVKSRPVDVALIARQIETYREGSGPDDVHVAAICWVMNERDRATLTDRRITVVRLGEPFEKWCRETPPRADLLEL